MNVAYCFSGHSRTYRHCSESFFENVFSIAPGDIFIHTWDKASAQTPSYWNGLEPLSKEQLDIVNQPTDKEDLVRTYSPKQIMISSDREPLEVPGKTREHLYCYGLKSYYESVRRSVNMAMTYSSKYDRIFHIRLDIEFLEKTDRSELNDTILRNAKHHYLLSMGVGSDLFAHGTQEQINKLADYYWYIDSYFLTSPQKQYHEQAWYRYMTDNGVKMLPSNIKFRINRLFGEPTYFPCA